MSRIEPSPCPVCRAIPIMGWDHEVGYPQRFGVSCDGDQWHRLRVVGRHRAEAVRRWNTLANGGIR